MRVCAEARPRPRARKRPVNKIYLGVNVDHVATIRQARGTTYPSVLNAALAAERGGATGITIHLREDRRHIQDADVHALAGSIGSKLNLEMAVSQDVVGLACKVHPADACIVPERREELTTEGGLSVTGGFDRVAEVTGRLTEVGTRVSLFIDPYEAEIDASIEAGAPVIELHTGTYADAKDARSRDAELARIASAATYAHGRGLIVNAGHGLTLENVAAIAQLPEIVELNIGHSIVGRALFVGMEEAAREMLAACEEARSNA
jgi:pyridoxine 5-phosphate synthase